MMLKHSRWSGRRLMPSGGGWMTPNPNGGVAACLVWNADAQTQPDSTATSPAATRSDAAAHDAQRPPFDKSTNYTDAKVRQPIIIDVKINTKLLKFL